MKVLSATGKYVLPGGVDQHVHMDYQHSGQRARGFEFSAAALQGGTTTIADFADKLPKNTLRESIELQKKTRMERLAHCDYMLHCNIKDPKESDYAEIPYLPKIGVASVNFFMSQNSNPQYCRDDQILRILEVAKKAGVTAFVHAENCDAADFLTKRLLAAGKTDAHYHSLARPISIEVESTARIAYFATLTEAPVMVVHLSSKEALAKVLRARQKGTPIYAETCPHYLVLDQSSLSLPENEGAKYICNPPLRDKTQQRYLWQALRDGDLLCVGTDHCAFNWQRQKLAAGEDFASIPKGIPGLADRLGILWTYGVAAGRISTMDLARVFAANPARVLGAYPRKGALVVGADADIVIYDPDYCGFFTNYGSLHGIDYNAYEGKKMRGRVDMVLLRGQTVFADGACCGQPVGKFIEAKPYGYCFSLNKQA
jgi:dihydropyrimidinase